MRWEICNRRFTRLDRQLMLAVATGAAMLCALTNASAQVSLTGSYTQDFNSLANSGTNPLPWTNNSTLPGWYLYSQPASAPVAISTYRFSGGSDTTGSFYSFGSDGSTDRALGGIGSGSDYFGAPASGAVAGWIAVQLINNTGNTFDSFTVSFAGEQWRDANNASQTMAMEYRFGTAFSGPWTAPGGSFNWSSPVRTSSGVVDGNAAGRLKGRGGTVASVWSIGQTLWIRWVERNDEGNDHALAIDDFTITGTIAPQLYWDLNGSGSGIGGAGPMEWNTLDRFWNLRADGTGELGALGPASHAVFGGTAGIVNVAAGGVATSAGIQFDSNGYVINSPAGGAITVGAGNAIAVTSAGHTATIAAPIAGTSGLTKTGNGALVLSGPNTYSGTTAVASGALFVNGTHSGAGDYVVSNTGAKLGGSGHITLVPGASVTIGDPSGSNAASGAILPGPAAGAIGNLTLDTSGASGATIFAPGGSFIWDTGAGSDHSQSPEASAPGTPGVNWDALALQKLSITATSGNAFKIVVSPLTGFAASQNPDKPGKWRLATFTSIQGFDLGKFIVDVSSVPGNLRTGDFFVRADVAPDGSGELDLHYAPEPSVVGAILISTTFAALRRRRRPPI